MLRALSRFGVRVGLAVGLIAVVAGVVTVARLVTDRDNTSRYEPGVPSVSSTVDPTSGDDGEVLPTPVYGDDLDVEQAAVTFTAAWLRRDESSAAWQAALAKLSTESLATSLKGVDPSTVPATRTTGQPHIVVRNDRYAQVGIAVDTGTLTLSLLKEGAHWLVDGVDWERL